MAAATRTMSSRPPSRDPYAGNFMREAVLVAFLRRASQQPAFVVMGPGSRPGRRIVVDALARPTPSLRAQRSNPWRNKEVRKNGLLRCARNDGETHFRDLAGRSAPRFALISRPLRIEGAGNAGRPMRPIAVCAMVVVERTHVSRSHRNHPAFPTQWF